MITIQEAIKTVEKKHPLRGVKEVADYKGKYLIAAPGKKFKMDYSDPYFLVDKETGSMSAFNPMMDLDGFQDAMAHHNLYRAK